MDPRGCLCETSVNYGMGQVRTGLLVVASAVALAACGDPLAGVEKLSDVTLAEGESRRDVRASPDAAGRQGGFLARLFAPQDAGSSGAAADGESASGATAADVAYGTLLPFAVVGRVCEAKSRPKGARVERSEAGYDLYDSAPGIPEARTFYVTGFADGCPRQFTAALAMFGAPSLHEQLRYGLPSDAYPYSDTDKAYEKVKSAICRVGRRKPCGSRIRTLERNTVFVSTYERSTYNGRWADILIHDGSVLATSLKDP